MLWLRRYVRQWIENRRFESRWVSMLQIFTQKGTSPINHFRTDGFLPYKFVADSFHTKKLCSSEIRFYTENVRFVLLSPPPPCGQRTMIILGSLESA